METEPAGTPSVRIPDQPIQLEFRTVRRRFVGRYRRAVGPLEVAALLNVLALIGMFHFASARFVLQPGVRLRLPEAPFHDGVPYRARVLTLAQGGLVFYNDELVTLPALAEALAHPLPGAGDLPLLIEADEGITYGRLMEIYAMARKAGIREIMLATRPPPVEP